MTDEQPRDSRGGPAQVAAFLDTGPASTSLIQNSLNSTVLGRYIVNARNGVVEPPCDDADLDLRRA